MIFRKKPVLIEAFQWSEELQSEDWPDWFLGAIGRGEAQPQDECCLIKTLEGTMRASYQDWIIRGVKGEIYPCKPDIFAATYEPVDA